MQPRRDGFIISARRNPQPSVAVGSQAMQIQSYGYFLHLFHSVTFHDRNGIVVVGHPVATRVGNIDIFAEHIQFVGLVAYCNFAGDFQSSRIHFEYRTQLSIRIDRYRSDVCRHVCFPAGETNVAAVGNIYLPDTFAGAGIHHFYFVRAVDDGIQFVPVYLYIVPDVAQLFDHIRVPLGVQAAYVVSVYEIYIVDRGFVAAHIAFVEQIHADRFVCCEIGFAAYRHR